MSLRPRLEDTPTALIVAQLLDDLVQPMLHAVGQVVRGLAHRVDAVGQHLPHILQGGLVALARLEGLRAAHQGLHVVGLVLQHSRGVGDGALEVGQLLVAGGAVGVALQSQFSRLHIQRTVTPVRLGCTSVQEGQRARWKFVETNKTTQ
jgi:hypothetical protein